MKSISPSHSRALPLLFALAALCLCAIPLLADPTNAPALPPPELDDFNPGLLLMVMVMLVAWTLLAGLGLAVGLVAFTLAGALAAFGILSSSVVIAFLRRSPASGLRALFLQLGAVAGVPCGMVAMWLTAWFTHSHWSTASRLVTGAACGLACGLGVALLFNLAWGKLAAWLLRRYEARKSTAPTPTPRA